MSVAIATSPKTVSADALAKQFHKDGFVLIPGVLNNDEIAQLRSFALDQYDKPETEKFKGDTDKVLFAMYNRHPSLRWLLFKEPTLNVVRKILGDSIAISREAAIQKGYYARWHKDSSPQERGGCYFQWQPDYFMVQVAYYMQDNDPHKGGGLDVEPGSHRQKFDPFLRRERPTKFQQWMDKYFPLGEAVKHGHSILSKAGDAVIFHFRMNHRATQNVSGDANVPLKLAYMQNFSRNNRYVADYVNFMLTVPEYVYLKDYAWDPDLVSQAKALGIAMG